MVGVLSFFVTVHTGRADSAVLFVGLPVTLAVALALVPGRTGHGRVFGLTTVALLLAAVLLHEGAICVLLAAPLVYLVVHGTTALIHAVRRHSSAHVLVLLPLLLVTATEGTGTGWRVTPDQRVEVARVVALPADEVAARLAAGPRPVPVRSLPLRLLRVPMPQQVSGDGLADGDRWLFAYHGSAHGPGGHLLAEVDRSGPGRVGFRFVTNSSITGRWLDWQRADLSWRAVDPAQTEVRVTVAYRRGLDPSWYFGPLQDALMHRGVGHLLDMLALP
ncbi:hypothetical protein ACN28G_12785 [Micromonospora sp. WMMA1923]|uniref:hypothetical protein n=1 Tax=Micromonospora sp. WMMA1923 TaxID=3404125 RepID=UPI003B95D84F